MTCNAMNYQNAITIAADDVTRLRKVDVFRVLDSMQNNETLDGMASYLIANRPDLADEISVSLAEIRAERK